jgi:hypothetical protein
MQLLQVRWSSVPDMIYTTSHQNDVFDGEQGTARLVLQFQTPAQPSQKSASCFLQLPQSTNWPNLYIMLQHAASSCCIIMLPWLGCNPRAQLHSLL